ncbi:cytochrome c-type biogenesis protein CcmH [Aquabacterium sp. A7-Y]|uniref:cytochrome c-type biogenesis protein n=1 Tax=Aquabacterium sp. A7-Y TaxID=1349605 RepID=UPI00223E2548|nr:cytochrome c-type biogenesis protein [Aquabacterium sp. A7-Y]MCW7540894.1 cytochrome c-type biogenesis protein CcmH [Aquabacterium sp. A7-Y]
MKRRLCLLLLTWACAAAAQHETRLQTLAAELRCPVCQNQSLADSNAELAADLREEIRRQLAAGRTDQQVRDFMVSRYGEFVLYDPPLQTHTVVLWAAPFAMLVGAAGVLAWRARGRCQLAQASTGASTPASEDQP